MSRPGFRVSDQLLQNIVFPGVTCNIYGSTPYYGLAANLSNIGTITADRVIANSLCGGFITGIINNGTTGLLAIGSNSGRGTYTVSSNLTLLGVGALGGAVSHGAVSNSVIIGEGASYNSSNEENSVIIGKSAGATRGNGANVLIGRDARYTAGGDSSVVIGAYAASNATSVVASVIIGPYAARTEASSLANVFIVNNDPNLASNSLLYGIFANAIGGVASGYRGRLGVNCVPGRYGIDVEYFDSGSNNLNAARFRGNVLACNYTATNASGTVCMKVFGNGYEGGGDFYMYNASGQSTLIVQGQDAGNAVGMFLRSSNGSNRIRMYGNDGNAYAVAWNVTSDIRLKEMIEPISHGVSIVNSLRPVEYTFSNDTDIHYGFIAQEVQPVLPAIVKDVGGIYSVNVTEIIPFLVKSVQELAERVQTLEARLSQPSS